MHTFFKKTTFFDSPSSHDNFNISVVLKKTAVAVP